LISGGTRVGFAEIWVWGSLREAELRFLLLFPEKEENIIDLTKTTRDQLVSPGSASPRSGYGVVFCEAELRFLLLFLEKEGLQTTESEADNAFAKEGLQTTENGHVTEHDNSRSKRGHSACREMPTEVHPTGEQTR
jgi:hypothetical protein